MIRIYIFPGKKNDKNIKIILAKTQPPLHFSKGPGFYVTPMGVELTINHIQAKN